MKYMISSISDVVTEEGGDDWERVMYVDRTAPLARESGLGNGIIDMKALLDLAEELTPDATAAIESYEPEASVQWLKDNGFIS